MGSIDRQQSTPQLMNRLRMRQVALLLAIDELGTLSSAAERLGLTQPAATKMLGELEQALGQKLFDRVGRGLQRNAAGERVTGFFRSIRGSMEALAQELEVLHQGGGGRLAVGSIMAASPGRLTRALLQLKAEFPLLALEVAVDTSDRLLAQLREGVLEMVIGRKAAVPGVACSFQPIEDEELAVIAGNEHPLARRRSLEFGALLDYPWILQPQGSPMRDLIEHEFRHHDAELPRGLVETGSILTTINLVRSSPMLGVIPQAVAAQHAQHGMLSVLRYKFRNSLDAYGSLVPRDRPLSAPAARFLELLHAKS
ncbi:LysR family transcriptional regulator [Ramlibacter sp. G-1-2-2]|uniref:LysR family transcriptional regulator n=1 Tax=Ramlibacter agri TaxID=2728837 RepID=A0A848H8Q5_9BURK|nr:LysR family transcriptional regulator [Ramlibacter agri]